MQLHALEPLLVAPGRKALAAALFGAVATARFAPLDGLLALFGPDGLTRDELDAWTAAGLLHRARVVADPVEAREVEYFALAPRGARALEAATGLHVAGVSAARLDRSSQKRAHDVAVGTFALAAMALEREGRLTVLALETDPARFSASALLVEPGVAPERIALQADAYVLTKGSHGPTGLLVEIDRGTIGTSTMAKKYRGYLAWKEVQGPENDFAVRALRVLTVAPDARRLARLHDAALEANHGKGTGFLLFATDAAVSVREPERFLAPVARALDPSALRSTSVF
jgi:hypothetical protein